MNFKIKEVKDRKKQYNVVKEFGFGKVKCEKRIISLVLDRNFSCSQDGKGWSNCCIYSCLSYKMQCICYIF